MAYSALGTYITSEVLEAAADMNKIADNFAASAIGLAAAAGDLFHATGTTTLARLALGTERYVYEAGASAPAWADLNTKFTRYIGPFLLHDGVEDSGWDEGTLFAYEIEMPAAGDFKSWQVWTGGNVSEEVEIEVDLAGAATGGISLIASGAQDGSIDTGFTTGSFSAGQRVTFDPLSDQPAAKQTVPLFGVLGVQFT